MARKSEEQLFRDWTGRITREERKQRDRSREWAEYIRFYRQDQDESANGATLNINYHFGITRVILPSIYFRNPDVMVTSRKDGFGPYAKVLEDLLRYMIDEIGFEYEQRRVIFDCLMTGHGVMKFGFSQALNAKGPAPATLEDAVDALFDDMYSGELTRRPEKQAFESNQRVQSALPFAIRVSPFYFLIDDLATCLEDARWVCHIVLRTVEEVQANPRYAKSLTQGIQGTRTLDKEDYINLDRHTSADPGDRRFAEGESELVRIYEVWDRETNELLVFDEWNMNQSQGKPGFLRRVPWPYQGIDGFPFEMLIFNPDPESPRGVSDAKVWHNLTQATNLVRSMQYNHIKRFNRKYLARQGMLDPEQRDLLTSPHDGQVVIVNGDPNTDVVPLQDAPLSPDIYNMGETLRREMEFLSGMTDARKGTEDTKARTATEASIVESAAKVRDNDRVYVVSKFVERAWRKLLQLCREFLTPDDIAYMVNEIAAMLWTSQDPGMLKAEVDVKVRVGSSAYMSREVRAKQLLDFLNLTAQMIDPLTGMPVVNVRAVIERVADALDIEDYQQLLLPPGMPGMIPGMEMMMGQGGMMGPGGPQGPPGQGQPQNGQPPMARQALRNGAPNLGNLLSSVQNVGARPTAPPNPRNQG